MSIEDFLTVHGPETTGTPLPAESEANLDLTVLVKMASNGMPVAIDTASPLARAALARGKASFYRRVGERNHACADCHTPDKGANKFLGGRLLADVTEGMTRHFPTWRTSQTQLWDMRKRMQWCMTPLGMNMLPSDAIEYAELTRHGKPIYLTTFDIERTPAGKAHPSVHRNHRQERNGVKKTLKKPLPPLRRVIVGRRRSARSMLVSVGADACWARRPAWRPARSRPPPTPPSGCSSFRRWAT